MPRSSSRLIVAIVRGSRGERMRSLRFLRKWIHLHESPRTAGLDEENLTADAMLLLSLPTLVLHD